MIRSWALLIALTLALGTLVAISWTAFGGRLAAGDPLAALGRFWPAIYGWQALAAGLVGAILAGGMSAARVGLLAAAAWIGQLIFLTALGNVLVANELDPGVAWFYWLIATGGPMQPAAVAAGGILRRLLASRA